MALLFKDVATFNAQNPIIDSLLRETDLAKKGKNSDLIKKQLDKAPDINDTILIQRFKKFKDDPVTFNNSNNNNDDDDNNNNKPNYPAGPALPTFNDFQNLFQTPTPPSYQVPSVFNKPTIFQQQQAKSTFGKVYSMPTGPGEQVMSEIERVVEKAKHEEEVERIIPSGPLLEYFQKADEILKTDFVLQKEREKSVIDDFKKEDEVDVLTDQIDR